MDTATRRHRRTRTSRSHLPREQLMIRLAVMRDRQRTEIVRDLSRLSALR